MNAEELTAFLEEHKDEFNNTLKNALINSMTERVKWDLPNLIEAHVKSFYETQMKGQIDNHLAEHKPEIMAVVTQACVDSAKAVAIGMAEQIKASMDSKSYYRADIFKALFNYR